MRTTLFSAIAAITIGTVAVAQQAPPSPQAGDRAGWMQARFEEFAKMKQRRADDIALLIGVTAAQRPAFDAMLTAMEPPHRAWGKDGKPPLGPGAADEGTLARLDHMSAKIDERGASEKAKLATLRSFYAGLTPDQKMRFDALDRLRHDHGRMSGGHHDGHGPEMGPSPRG
jgi:LTXXQ motif family protein